MPTRALLPLAGLAVLGVLSASCSGSQSAQAVPATSETVDATVPDATPPVSPTPTAPEVRPVHGSVTYEGVRLDRSGTKLFVPGSSRDARPALDEAAMRDFIGSVARTLDLHLTGLQAGEDVTLPAPLDATAAPAAARAATTDLTSPDAIVDAAVYDVDVAVDNTAHWAHVVATVTRTDGSVRRAEFVFAAGENGPEMIAAGSHAGGDA